MERVGLGNWRHTKHGEVCKLIREQDNTVMLCKGMTPAFWLKVIRCAAEQRGRQKTWWSVLWPPIASHSSACPYTPCVQPWQHLSCTAISGTQLQNSHPPPYSPATCRPVQNTGSPIRHLHKRQNILHLDNSGYGLPAPIAALTDTPFSASLSGHTKQPFHLFKRPQQFTQEIFALDAALTLTLPPDVVYSVSYSFTP